MEETGSSSGEIPPDSTESPRSTRVSLQGVFSSKVNGSGFLYNMGVSCWLPGTNLFSTNRLSTRRFFERCLRYTSE